MPEIKDKIRREYSSSLPSSKILICFSSWTGTLLSSGGRMGPDPANSSIPKAGSSGHDHIPSKNAQIFKF